MSLHQRATVEFDGGCVEVIVPFWMPTNKVIEAAKERLGPALAEAIRNPRVTSRLVLHRGDEDLFRRYGDFSPPPRMGLAASGRLRDRSLS